MANLYLRDPAGNALYPEPAIPGNMVYLNYSPYGPYSETLAGSLQSQGIRFTDLVASHFGENAYNSWRDGRNEMLFVQANGGSIDGEDEIIRNSLTDNLQISLQTQLGILNGHNLPLQQSNISNGQGQGLSLSLGTQIPVPSFKYQVVSSSPQSSLGNGETFRDEQHRSRILNASTLSYGLANTTSIIPNSRYLKTAQQLLDEVVNIQKVLKQKTGKTHSVNTSDTPACKENDGGAKSDGNPSNNLESNGNSSSEISPSERQELQNKLTKLLAMLEEVDRRYKQYYHQMQIVVSSFDSIAGTGAAKPYTVLALQTISRHFRCLRDAISDQVRCTRKNLGEKEGSSGKGGGISRLRYIDQHIRQQRAIQQLGVMPQHAWRPQRGLPENSVTILRAWLFEHFLHPYPNDSEKLILARQTGLTRSQVSNWFINARVRLWKPMVEDMYKEEFGVTEMDYNSSSENATKGRNEFQSSDAREDQPSSVTETCQTNQSSHSHKQDLISGTHTEGGALDFQSNPTDQRPQDLPGISALHSIIRDVDGSSRFMAYPMTELSRYGGVSLTLGLQHYDGNLADSDGQQGFLAMRGEEEMYNAAPSLGFGPSQLLHDFVA